MCAKERGLFGYNYKDIPHKFPKEVKPLLNKIADWLEQKDLLGDAFVVAPNVWEGRKEEYCLNADAILVIDGSPLHNVLNGWTSGAARYYNEFSDLLAQNGYFFELGTSWYLGLYPIEPRKIRKTPKKKPTLKLEDVTLELVKSSTFGCCNCLWRGCECKSYEKFAPEVYDNQPTCKGYTYYD